MEFSLVIPTYNRSEALALTLERLEALAYPRSQFEVLVVDDGSTDDTRALLDGFRARLPLQVLQQNRGGAGAARNRGIRAARGVFVLFIDDDVLPCAELLQEHHETHRGYLRRMVRGPVINFPELPPPGPPRSLWSHYSMNYLCTSNASLRRDWLFQAGLFDESFDRWEDAELGVRLKRAGVERAFNVRAYVHHWKPHPTQEQRLETARRDGRSAAQLYRRYPGLRMWLRSGLHAANTTRNAVLLKMPLRDDWRRTLEVESAYLRSGREELGKCKSA